MNRFNDCALMGIRAIAEFCEQGDVMRVGDTHLATRLVDYRTESNDAYFMPLIGALGRAQIEELSCD